MKKKIIIISSIIILTIINMGNIKINKKDIYKEEKQQIEEKKPQNNFNNNLAMMIETEVGSGIYEKTTLNNWQTNGYTYNSALSKCENGGKIEFNEETNKVIIKGNISDKCYIYFEKYVLPKITSLSTSNITPTSLYARLTTQVGTNNIVKYYYSISTKENDENYIETTSSTYNFTNLNPLTKYYIKAYVVDSNNRKSKTNTTSATTTIYEWAKYKYETTTTTIPEKYEIIETNYTSSEEVYRKQSRNNHSYYYTERIYFFDTYTFADGEININETGSKLIEASYGSPDSGTIELTSKYFCIGNRCRKTFYSSKSLDYDGWDAPPSSDSESIITVTASGPYTEYNLKYTSPQEETTTTKKLVGHVTSTNPNQYPSSGDYNGYYYQRTQ